VSLEAGGHCVEVVGQDLQLVVGGDQSAHRKISTSDLAGGARNIPNSPRGACANKEGTRYAEHECQGRA
jgi:hypothetical protein